MMLVGGEVRKVGDDDVDSDHSSLHTLDQTSYTSCKHLSSDTLKQENYKLEL